jgi:hypothetical protein
VRSKIIAFWNWSASWPWFTVLFGGATLGMFTISEFGWSIFFLILAAFGSFSKLLHGQWSSKSKQLGTIGILLALVALIYIINEEKGEKPLSHLSRPISLLFAREMQLPKPVPPSGNWASKLTDGTPKAEWPVRRSRELRNSNASVPPLRGTDAFVTYMILDANKDIFCPSKMPSIRLESCGDMHNVLSRLPKTENVIPTLAALLQHYAVAIIFGAGQRWGMYGPGDKAFIHDFIAPVDPPDVQTYSPHSATHMSALDGMFSDGLKFMWDVPQMRLPKETAISFVEMPTENQEPVCSGVRLERKDYYNIDICFKLYQRIALLPQEYQDAPVGPVNTYAFEVHTDWTINRSRQSSFVYADYDSWAKQLFERTRERLVN